MQIEPDDFIHVLGPSPKHSVEEELRAVCRSQEEAFFLCDVDDIVRKVRLWRRVLPRVRPHYAVKCNASRAALNTLAALGVGFDCASKGEIEKVLSLGVAPSRIIFAHPAKPAGHIRFAASLGVNLATFDNEDELYKIRALHSKCKLVLRIRCDAQDAMVCLGVKYGCDPERDAPALLRTARALGLQVVGVSFHVGSGCRDPDAYRAAVRAARGVFDVAATLGIRMTLLDVGGGYPGDNDPAFLKMAEVLNTSISEYFPSPEVDVISEPGCYFVASAFTLATNVHSKREVRGDNGDLLSVMYYINDGLYGSFFDILQKRTFRGEPLELHGVDKDKTLIPSSVWGPTCDGLDKVEDGVLLPPLELGSWLVYRNVGAYTLAIASTFNSFPISKVHAVASTEKWSLLRDRAPLSDAHFVPSLASGKRHSSASLVDPLARFSQDAKDTAPRHPYFCRRGSVIDHMDLASRPIY